MLGLGLLNTCVDMAQERNRWPRVHGFVRSSKAGPAKAGTVLETCHKKKGDEIFLERCHHAALYNDVCYKDMGFGAEWKRNEERRNNDNAAA